MGTAPEGGGSGSGGGGTSPTTVTSAEAHSGTEAVSGTTAEATIAPIPVDILEFDDKLFHDGSCVMMPEIPAPEGDADEDDDRDPGDPEKEREPPGRATDEPRERRRGAREEGTAPGREIL